MEQRKIIHFDMDAFYASVEILDNPILQGMPVVVGGSPESRAVVCTANYVARKFGIRSAMPCSNAKRLCPNTIFISPRFERYREISAIIHQVFQKYTDKIEPLSLDEAWLDVTKNKINCPSATWIAKSLKKDIRTTTGLTGSAGVSYNKFLAKIASDEDKPDGLFVITPQSAQLFLAEIEIRKIPGVGRVTQKRLQQLAIEKGSQLQAKSEGFLVNHLGKLGHYLYHIIRGLDLREVEPRKERKSVGIENTFAHDIYYGDELKEVLKLLLIGLEKRLKQAGKRGRTLTLKVKFEDFKQLTRSVSTKVGDLNEDRISVIAYQKLAEVCQKFTKKRVRLLGVAVSNFPSRKREDDKNQQLDFYSYLGLNILGNGD